MRKLLLFITVLSFFGGSANAQFKINDKIFSTGFTSDTAVSISIRVVNLQVLLESKAQRPIFYLSFDGKNGQSVTSRNISYEDMKVACQKNGIPEAQHETIIAQTFTAVYSGTKAQKLGAIRGLLDNYGIIVKPDTEQ